MRYSVELSPRTDRLQSLDILRGVAVLGILVMNIYAFAMPWAAYTNPLAYGGTGTLDVGTWFVTHVFFDQKFMSIFSMLFGAGIAMLASRCDAAEKPFAPLFFRRQGWLLVIGALHAYLLWYGDILFFYAVVGTLAWFFYRLPAHKLITLALLLLPIAPLLGWAGAGAFETIRTEARVIERQLADGESISQEQQQALDDWVELRQSVAPGPVEIEAELAAYRSDYLTILAYRAPAVAELHGWGIPWFGLWRIGGLMLVGMALFKLGLFGASCPESVHRDMLIAGYGIGLPLCVFSAANQYAHDFDGLYLLGAGGTANYVGSILVAFGHMGLILTAWRRNWLPALTSRLAAVGRMALSNYLAHSIILTTLFYGYGLGLYGEIGRAGQMLIVAGVGGLQIWLSPLWLKHFRFGPAEWLWRSLSYGQRQPLRR